MTEPLYGLAEGAAKLVEEMANEHRQRLPGSGRRTRRVGLGVGSLQRIILSASTCGGCTTPPDNITVDLGDGLMASTDYSFAPFCADWVIFRFVHSGTGGLWNGVADTEEVECTPDEPVSFTASLQVIGKLPGQVVATISDGVNDWTFENEAAWQPDQPIELVFKSGPSSCPCAPFRSEVCLVPIPAAEEEEEEEEEDP